MAAIIYLLTNTVNGKQYVGQTSMGLDWRWRQHCTDARCSSTAHLHKAIRKYGPDAFIREILEHTTTEDVNAREVYWIAELKSKEMGYNMTEGGGGMRGLIPTTETRNKRSVSMKIAHERNPNLRQRISVANKTRERKVCWKPKTIKASSYSLSEHNYKKSLADPRRRAVIVEGHEYHGLREAARQTGYTYNTLRWNLIHNTNPDFIRYA